MYYKIKDSLNAKLVGSGYPQAYTFMKEYDSESPQGIYKLLRHHSTLPLIDFIPDLDGIKLSGRAKLSDFVSNGFAGPGFQILSSRAWELLATFNLSPYRVYPLGLYKRNVKQEYLAYYMPPLIPEEVEFRKSKFYIIQNFTDVVNEPIQISSYEDLIVQKKALEKSTNYHLTIRAKELFISVQETLWYDIFDFDDILNGPYISERLKDAIEKEGLTGWEFIPAVDLRFKK